MGLQIGNLTFDRVHYDAGGDVLYLHRADPQKQSTSTPPPRATRCASTPQAS